jgi:hypothetical protein
MEDSRGAPTATGAACSSHTAATTSADTEAVHHQQRAQAQAYPEHGSWLCCVPCYWLRRNNSVHKASLTVVTLLVTSLLVASPVLFLISSVPSREGDRSRDCHYQVSWVLFLLRDVVYSGKRIMIFPGNKLRSCKIWGFHGGDYEEWRLLGCYDVWLL